MSGDSFGSRRESSQSVGVGTLEPLNPGGVPATASWRSRCLPDNLEIQDAFSFAFLRKSSKQSTDQQSNPMQVIDIEGRESLAGGSVCRYFGRSPTFRHCRATRFLFVTLEGGGFSRRGRNCPLRIPPQVCWDFHTRHALAFSGLKSLDKSTR